MIKDVKIEEDDWGEIAKLKIDLKQNKMSQTIKTVLQFYKDNNGKKILSMQDILKTDETANKFIEEEVQKRMALIPREPCVKVIAVPESLKERIEQMITEKYGDIADRNEEAIAAWKTWLDDYEATKRNFAKVRERLGLPCGTGEFSAEEMLGANYNRAVLSAFLRHGFLKQSELGGLILIK